MSGSSPGVGDCALGGAKNVEESVDPSGELAGLILTSGKRLRLEMDGSEITHRGHDRRRVLGRERTIRSGREWRSSPDRLNLEDGPAEAGERDFLVILAQQSWPAEGRGKLAGAIDDSADDERVIEIRGSDRVHSQDGDSHRAAFERDAVDVASLVIFDRTGDLAQIGPQPFTVDFADKDFREAGRWRCLSRRLGLCGIVDCQCGFVQIALELKAGGLDELFVIRVVGYGWQLAR